IGVHQVPSRLAARGIASVSPENVHVGDVAANGETPDCHIFLAVACGGEHYAGSRCADDIALDHEIPDILGNADRTAIGDSTGGASGPVTLDRHAGNPISRDKASLLTAGGS